MSNVQCTHRVNTVCTKPELLQKELLHLREALVKCKYPQWAINRVQTKFINNNWGKTMITTSKLTTTTQVQWADKNSFANNALHDHNRQSENTIGNNASQDHNNSTTNTEEATTTISKPKVGLCSGTIHKGIIRRASKTYMVSMAY